MSNIFMSMSNLISKIKQIIKEEIESKGRIRKILFKFWDTELEKGKKPTINKHLTDALNISRSEIMKILIDYYGGLDVVIKLLKNDLTKKQLTTNDMKKLKIDVGGYNFKFTLDHIELNDNILECHYNIDSGTVITLNNQTYDLRPEYHDEIPTDVWWEMNYEIQDLIRELINKISNSYGIYLMDIELYEK